MSKQFNRKGFVTIKKHFPADLQVVVAIPKYNNELEYTLLSLVIAESIIVEEPCTEEGIPDGKLYREPRYGACRMNDDIIEICHDELGWIPADEKLNEAYSNILAEKALLEDK